MTGTKLPEKIPRRFRLASRPGLIAFLTGREGISRRVRFLKLHIIPFSCTVTWLIAVKGQEAAVLIPEPVKKRYGPLNKDENNIQQF